MTLGTPSHHGTASGAAGATAVIASFTPQADSHLFVFGGAYRGSAAATDPSITDSVGFTWTPLLQVINDPGSGGRMTARLWVTAVGSSPAAMTVTVSGASNTTNVAGALSITGADSDFSNIDGDTSIVTAVTPVLGSTPAVTSTVLGWAYSSTSTAWNTTSGYTDLVDVTLNGTRLLSCYDAASASATFAATSANVAQRGCGIALEVKEAATAVTGTVAATASVIAAVSGSPVVQATAAPAIIVTALAQGAPVVTGSVTGTLQVSSNIQGTVGGATEPEGLPDELLHSPFIVNLGVMMGR